MKLWPGTVMWNCPLQQFSTLRVGGPATAVVFPANIQDVSRLLKRLRVEGIPWRVIGRGSNILVPDQGFSGVVLVFSRKFAKVETLHEPAKGEVIIRAQAGCSLAGLGKRALEQGLSGVEFAVSIPGSVGGGVNMNAGAWGMELSDIVAEVSFLAPDGEIFSSTRSELRFSYRHLEKLSGAIILSVDFLLSKAERHEIAALIQHYMQQRRQNQPQGVASVGSFFKNPSIVQPAGLLIEQAGLKGKRVGGAVVSDVHANFLINTGKATASDFLELMCLIQRQVEDDFAVTLIPEVDIWSDVHGSQLIFSA